MAVRTLSLSVPLGGLSSSSSSSGGSVGSSGEYGLDALSPWDYNPESLKSDFDSLNREMISCLREAYGRGEKPFLSGQLPINVTSNRYSNILPYEHSRVRLQHFRSLELPSDYINANAISLFCGGGDSATTAMYIATQGPLSSTTRAFWLMVWEQKVSAVVMLTRRWEKGVEKCHKYWPDTNETLSYPSGSLCPVLTVSTISIEYLDAITRRKISVRFRGNEHVLDHFAYSQWADFGTCNASTVVSLSRMVSLCARSAPPSPSSSSSSSSPILVHCSAGVGRAGSFLTIHSILEDVAHHQGECSGIDVTARVKALRKHRFGMVQTCEQFCFIHQTIALGVPAVLEEVAAARQRRNCCSESGEAHHPAAPQKDAGKFASRRPQGPPGQRQLRRHHHHEDIGLGSSGEIGCSAAPFGETSDAENEIGRYRDVVFYEESSEESYNPAAAAAIMMGASSSSPSSSSSSSFITYAAAMRKIARPAAQQGEDSSSSSSSPSPFASVGGKSASSPSSMMRSSLSCSYSSSMVDAVMMGGDSFAVAREPDENSSCLPSSSSECCEEDEESLVDSDDDVDVVEDSFDDDDDEEEGICDRQRRSARRDRLNWSSDKRQTASYIAKSRRRKQSRSLQVRELRRSLSSVRFSAPQEEECHQMDPTYHHFDLSVSFGA